MLASWASLAAAPEARAAEPPRVAIVFTPHQTYRDAASTIEAALTKKDYTCVRIELPKSSEKPSAGKEPEAVSKEKTPFATGPDSETTSSPETTPSTPTPMGKALNKLTDARPDLIVTSGTKATSIVLEAIPDTPVIFCMVPNALDAPFMAPKSPHRKRLAGVTTDVPPDEQLEWIVRVHGESKTIGVLFSSRTRLTVEAIRSAAKPRATTVVPIEARKDEIPKAIDELNRKRCDGVIMLLDAGIYNKPNIKRLLLWGMRQKKGVWAFSDNIVQAGALAGLHVDMEVIAKHAADLVQEVTAGADVAKIGLKYAAPVCVAVNERTADMIGVSLSRRVREKVEKRFGKDH